MLRQRELPHKKGNRRQLQNDSLPHNIGNHKKKGLPVTKRSNREYIDEIRSRYKRASKQEQGIILNEMILVCKCNRKYLIRTLNKKPVPEYPKALYGGPKKKAGHPKEYGAPEILAFFIYFWHRTNQACGKRLKAVVPLWLSAYVRRPNSTLTLEQQVLILRISPASIDRMLADERNKYRVGKGRATTKPGTLLAKHIPIKTDQWKEQRPGFLEVDTVGHCGTSTAGQYAVSLDTVDIASGWTEARAAWGKGETGIVKALRSIEEALPFPLRGLDSDNGSEFINHHMDTYLTGRKRSVAFTRSRPYKKNDNAHIEQKNWTHIRQTFGYERFDNPEVVDLMNDLYAKEFTLLMNYFLPSVKLLKKERIGSKIIKRYDQPKTPMQRLVESRLIPEETKLQLQKKQQSLDPFLLHETMQRKVKAILRLCSLRPQPSTVTAPKHPKPDNQCRKPKGQPHRHTASATPRGGLMRKLNIVK